MTDSTEEEYFTSKHAKLDNIARVANTFAWIALGAQLVHMGGRFVQLQNLYMTQAVATGFGPFNFMEMLGQNAGYTFSLIVDLASILIRGIVYWLILKSISAGLYMIVETDLNYRENIGAVNNE